MSQWTHIIGAIHIDTYTSTKYLKEYVEKMLLSAPQITGSESDAAFFVNVDHGHSIWASADCKSCKYEDTITHCKEGGFTCESPDGFVCPEGEYQTRCTITIVGDLRDRTKAETHREWKAFQRYIAKDCGFGIRNCTCRIGVF